MLNLLGHYTLEQIITFIVLLSLAVKGCISFIDWARQRLYLTIDRVEAPKKLKNSIENHEEEISKLNQAIDKLTKMVNLLIESDKDDIKAFITREYHYFTYQKGWIDDYSLDCVEKRFEHYKQEGGNSFIESMMQTLRTLPRKPVEDIKGE